MCRVMITIGFQLRLLCDGMYLWEHVAEVRYVRLAAFMHECVVRWHPCGDSSIVASVATQAFSSACDLSFLACLPAFLLRTV